MRMAINCVGWGDMDTPVELCTVLQHLEMAYKTYCITAGGEMGRKIQVLKQSVAKVSFRISELAYSYHTVLCTERVSQVSFLKMCAYSMPKMQFCTKILGPLGKTVCIVFNEIYPENNRNGL